MLCDQAKKTKKKNQNKIPCKGQNETRQVLKKKNALVRMRGQSAGSNIVVFVKAITDRAQRWD